MEPIGKRKKKFEVMMMMINATLCVSLCVCVWYRTGS